MQPSQIVKNKEQVLENYCCRWSLWDEFEKMKQEAASGDEKAVVKTANDIWWKLPDHPEIREQGFFVLCDIAEQIFEEDTE